MDYIFLIQIAGLLGLVGLAIAYFTLAWLGTYIETLPTKKSNPNKSLTSPGISTRIAGILFMVGYIISEYATLQDDKMIIIFGVVGMIAMYMFMATSIVFSFAVINAINAKNEKAGVSG